MPDVTPELALAVMVYLVSLELTIAITIDDDDDPPAQPAEILLVALVAPLVVAIVLAWTAVIVIRGRLR